MGRGEQTSTRTTLDALFASRARTKQQYGESIRIDDNDFVEKTLIDLDTGALVVSPDGAPNQTLARKNGAVMREMWIEDEQPHREAGNPAVIFYRDGLVHSEWLEHGEYVENNNGWSSEERLPNGHLLLAKRLRGKFSERKDKDTFAASESPYLVRFETDGRLTEFKVLKDGAAIQAMYCGHTKPQKVCINKPDSGLQAMEFAISGRLQSVELKRAADRRYIRSARLERSSSDDRKFVLRLYLANRAITLHSIWVKDNQLALPARMDQDAKDALNSYFPIDVVRAEDFNYEKLTGGKEPVAADFPAE